MPQNPLIPDTQSCLKWNWKTIWAALGLVGTKIKTKADLFTKKRICPLKNPNLIMSKVLVQTQTRGPKHFSQMPQTEGITIQMCWK